MKKEWLYSCLIQNKILNFEDFYFRSKSIETEFNFNLRDSINIAQKTREKRFLCEKNFWIPKENKLFNEFRDIIINAGGALKETKDPDKECIILLGTDQVDLIKSLKSKNLKIFSNELLLVGCLRQKLDFKEFCL